MGVKARNPTVNTERYTFQGKCAPAVSILMRERNSWNHVAVSHDCSARCVQGLIRFIGHDRVMQQKVPELTSTTKPCTVLLPCQDLNSFHGIFPLSPQTSPRTFCLSTRPAIRMQLTLTCLVPHNRTSTALPLWLPSTDLGVTAAAGNSAVQSWK